jgi:hypothetical protein
MTTAPRTNFLVNKRITKGCNSFSWRALITKRRIANAFYPSSTASLDGRSSTSSHNPQFSGGRASSNLFGSVAAFPWRHSPNPLPRLCLPDSSGIYEPIGPRGFAGFRSDSTLRFLMRISAARLMDISWLEIFLTPSSWETSLVNNFAAAFRTAMGCLFSNIFRVPLQRVVLEDENDVGGDTLVSFDSDSSNTNDNKIDGQGEEVSTVDEEQDIVDNSTLLQMLDSKLFNLYQQPESSSSQPALSVLLQMQVLSAKLENLHVIPFLTRDMVKHNPDLRGSIQEIIRNVVVKDQVKEQPYMETLYGAAEDFEGLTQKIVRGSSSSNADCSAFSDADENVVAFTIVAQVTILCKERFRAVDVHSGECVQGDRNANEQLVPHLVRFEQVTKYNQERQQWFVGQWKITDWDDLLDGNQWY